MPVISLTLSTAAAAELVDTLCELGGYRAVINNLPNPLTREQFARQYLVERIKRLVIERRQRLALAAADTTPPDITQT